MRESRTQGLGGENSERILLDCVGLEGRVHVISNARRRKDVGMN
jgi:hypothetical protein